MERLIEKDQDLDLAWIKGHLSDSCTDMCEEVSGECWRCDIMVCMERLADYEDAEEQGRLIKFPVAVGDAVYEVCEEKIIEERSVHGYLVGKDATYIAVGDGTSMNAKNMGKTFFRTREEAEAKLAEMEATDGKE